MSGNGQCGSKEHLETSSVSVSREAPVGPALSEGAARRAHKRAGFSSYQGPRLQGPRFEISPEDEGYPEALRCISRPPKRLFGIGDPGALQEGLAVVGARKATPYGRECAKRFASLAARAGIVIISGGARGCDSAAHYAALYEGAPTVAFLGGGCDQIYPAENYDLFQQIINTHGAVVSEHEWGYPALPHSFRERNRLIAGLARATLIVEAGLPSGTFSTADEALNASKEVLVVPGAITSASSRGANRLLYQGATPVVDDDSFQDILFALYGCLKQEVVGGLDKVGPPDASQPGPPDSSQLRNPLLAAISARPTSLEELCALVGNTSSEFGNALAQVAFQMGKYEREGLAVRLPDGRYAARVK